MRDDRLYLIHIRDAIARIEEYAGCGRQGFLESTLVQDAVLRNLQVLAESSQRLSESLKSRCPDVEWRAISGLRNVLVHDYLGVDIERVWQIVESGLPALKRNVAQMLAGP